MAENPYSAPKTIGLEHQPESVGAPPAVPLSARVAQVYLALMLVVALLLIGSLLTMEDAGGYLLRLGLFAYGAMAAANLLGIVALRARHSWSWAVGLCILWLYGLVAVHNQLQPAPPQPAHVERVTFETEPEPDPAARVGGLGFLFIACALPLYLTLVPRVRRTFRERAAFYERLRRSAR